LNQETHRKIVTDNEHIYSHKGIIKTVKNKITIREKRRKRKKNTNKNEIMK